KKTRLDVFPSSHLPTTWAPNLLFWAVRFRTTFPPPPGRKPLSFFVRSFCPRHDSGGFIFLRYFRPTSQLNCEWECRQRNCLLPLSRTVWSPLSTPTRCCGLKLDPLGSATFATRQPMCS